MNGPEKYYDYYFVVVGGGDGVGGVVGGGVVVVGGGGIDIPLSPHKLINQNDYFERICGEVLHSS